jgi:predicted transcriptional regulator
MSFNKQKDENNWTFLTNHAHVLLCLAKSSSMRIRDIAIAVGITERAVQRIIAELTESGYIDIIKEGRRNIYKLHFDMPLKHPIESHRNISDLIGLIYDPS